ncbi:MAG: sensor domain-containing diguanylate cyclase [Syntrophomonadaceae bacterium]
MDDKITNHAERVAMEERLRESEEKYRLLFETANDGILLIDRLDIIDCNRRAAEIFGIEWEKLRGSSVKPFIPPVQLDGRSSYNLLRENGERVLQGEPMLFEIGLCRADGSPIDVEISLNRIQLQGKTLVQVLMRDITDRKEMEEWLRYLNLHDKPTGLYNRNFFEEEMERMQSGRFDPVGVVVCDVDGLKLVNDNLGHQAGDELLAAVANVLLRSFRSSDLIARIGGDEFAILLPQCTTEAVEAACQRIRDNVAASRHKTPPVPISLSLGWAVKTKASENMEEVFKEADNLMYREKPHNREKFREFFNRTFMKPDAAGETVD